MRKHIKRFVLALLLLAVVGLLVWFNADEVERWVYPIEYRDHIDRSASQYGVDPLLVAAVIRAESNYQPHLVSKKGAVGLMQLMPNTAEWAAGKMSIIPPTLAQLAEPEINIRIGTWYLESLSEMFSGNRFVTLAAYNAGPTNVKRWLREGIWDGQEATMQQIPFGETRHYIKRVEHFYAKYIELYGDEIAVK